MTKLNKESAIKLQNDLRANGISSACATKSDGLGADGSTWEAYGVKAELKDARTGNSVRRQFSTDVDAAKEAKAMAKELKTLAKATRERIATEKFLDRS